MRSHPCLFDVVQRRLLALSALIGILSFIGCAGSTTESESGDPRTDPVSYTVGGTVSGLVGSGLTLQDNGGNNLPISANGSFVFTAALTNGSAYGVTVLTQPSSPSQTCVVTSGSGTLSGSNVTSVSVACTTNTYTVGGTVSGLAGSGLTLQDNGGNNLPISANGSFVFTAALANGSAYGVTVLTQPSSPSQTCAVTSGSGTLTGSNVTSVSVACTTNTYTVGGTVSGLAGSGLTLQDNGSNNLPISANGSFVFTAALANGSAYRVAVLTQPSSPSQTCAVTSGSGTLSGSNVTSVSVACTGSVNAATITWTDTYQTIDGFGASSAFESLTGAEADLFFSQTSGVGLSLLRTMVPDDGSCSSVNSSCAGAVSDMQLAVARGARVWSTPWSPPASMKSNGSTICNTGSGSSGLNSGSYGNYATYLSNYLSSLSKLYGIQLYALSVQNEPDYCPSTYAGAIWSDANFDAFIKNNLGPTLAAQGQSGVRIMMPESSQWGSFTGEADTCMTDPGCASYVGINAWHDYDDASSISNPYSSGGSGFWETEASAGPGFGPSLCGGCWDPSMADGLLWAGIIDNRMAVSNATAWNYWWLNGLNGDNEGLVNGGVTSKRLYVMGNYSKFVRPGWVRMDATHVPLSGVTVSAYKDPVSGNFAIVATNQNGSDVSVPFSLSGFTASSVTPWVTSTSLNLVQQSGIGVASGTFSATLPASSVTTFVGSAGN